MSLSEIPLQEILLATNNFAKENFIASGGYGPVYQGKSEKHGMIAVKRLDRKNGQGDVEFRKEIALLSEYKHKNIVSLLGFCDENDEKILVYKLESNGSLDKHLNNKDLSWTQRLRICLDAARGLKYLHDDVGPQERILHRDVKIANILLDERWNAKISDFGLCRIGPANIQTTLLISNACGTFGYIDPEYLYTGSLTQRSDVYSFGVVLFEVLCGRPTCIKAYTDERQFLPVLVNKHYPRQTLDKIIPIYLLHQIGKASLDTFLTIAYQCLKNGIERPTMNQVVQQLQKALDDQLVTKGYKLRFLTEVASPVYTGKKDGKGIEASDGNIEVELVDIETDQPVIDEPLASEKVKIVLLPEDFGAVNWTPSQFKNSILTHWGNKKNILLGDLSIDLKHGRGTIGKIWIKHDKNLFRKAKFRLGAMIDHCSYEIKEAITEPFEVKDRRNELTSKNQRLTLDDKVSRLKNVGRRGPCCKRLVNEKIKTVKDFLDRLSSNPVALQEIYGSSGKRWEQTVRHAKTSISDKQCTACESVGSASHGTEIAGIFVNHDGLTKLEVESYEPSPSSIETMSIKFDQFDPFAWNELLYEDPYYGLWLA